MVSIRRVVLVCAGVLSFVGCSKESKGTAIDFELKPVVTSGPWVAKYDGHTLTEGELSQRFMEMNPYARGRFQTADQRRDYLEGLVRYELMAQEALRRGLQNDPEVVDAAKRAMVQLLMKRELDQNAPAPTAAQVKAYYDAHKTDFVKPAMTRLSHIFFSKDHRAQAEATLKEALALPPLDYASFAKLARARSEEPRTQPLEGDMRYLSDDELTAQYGPELTAAAAKLVQAGELYTALVETEKGLHVLKLQGRQIALNLTVEAATPSIQSNLANESRQQRFKALIDQVEQKGHPEFNDEALKAMQVDLKSPALPAKSAPAGYMPAPSLPNR